MAQQKSILKLKGTIGGITFYKSKDGYLAREKGGVDASRIANDPGFARTREMVLNSPMQHLQESYCVMPFVYWVKMHRMDV